MSAWAMSLGFKAVLGKRGRRTSRSLTAGAGCWRGGPLEYTGMSGHSGSTSSKAVEQYNKARLEIFLCSLEFISLFTIQLTLCHESTMLDHYLIQNNFKWSLQCCNTWNCQIAAPNQCRQQWAEPRTALHPNYQRSCEQIGEVHLKSEAIAPNLHLQIA